MNESPSSHSERSEESGATAQTPPQTLRSAQGDSPVTGQVVQADIAKFTAGWPLLQTPPLGSLLKVEDGGSTIFAVVCDASTESIDGRPPVARLSGEADLESYLEKHPHLRHLLQTKCEAVVVGHQDGAQIHHYLPPSPAPLFAPVRPCSADETARFSQGLDFLKLLLASPTHSDETTAACLRRAAAAHVTAGGGSASGGDGRAFLVRAGKELARLLGTEPQRLTSILRRVRP
jgi:hypothetical protein